MKHIIFDIDGTIFDTKQGIIACLNDVLLSNGDEPIISEEENRYIGPSIKDSLMRFNGYSEKLAIASTKLYRERYVDYFIGDNTAISRSHAHIINREEHFYIMDTNSKNHTYIDGHMIPPNIEVEIFSGATIRLADEEFKFEQK